MKIKRYKEILSALLTSSIIPFILNEIILEMSISVFLKIIISLLFAIIIFVIFDILFAFIIFIYEKFLFRIIGSSFSVSGMKNELEKNIQEIQKEYKCYVDSLLDSEKLIYRNRISSMLKSTGSLLNRYEAKISNKKMLDDNEKDFINCFKAYLKEIDNSISN